VTALDMTADGMTEVTIRVNGAGRTQRVDTRMSLLDPMGVKGIGEIGITGTTPPSVTPCTTRPAAASGTCPSLPPSFSSDK
jgi:hypothetical protein